MTEPAPRPWWRWKRVWIPVAGVVLLLVVPAWGIRARGMARLREVRARHAAEGIGVDPEDLFATLPEVDAGRQARWRRFDYSIAGIDQGKLYSWNRPVDAWLVGAGDLPAAEIRAFLDRDRKRMEQAAAVLAEGPVHIGATGNLDRTIPPVPGRWRLLVGPHIANLLAAKMGAQWFRLEALTAGDPGPALAAIDRLMDGFRSPATLIDAMIALAVAEPRDRAYADLALAGRLPAEAEARWLTEEPEQLRWAADGFRGERLLFAGAIAQEMAEGDLDAVALAGAFGMGSRPGSPGDWVEERGAAIGIWLHGASDLATHLDLMARTEKALRGKGPPVGEEALARGNRQRSPLGEMLPNLMAGSVSAVHQRTVHRMARLLVRTVRLRGERGRFPADETELREWLGEDARLLDPGPLDQRILYANPAPGTVRFEPDLEGPRPALLERYPGDASRLPSRRKDFTGSILWSVLGIEVRFAPEGAPVADPGPAPGPDGGK